ncbi:MAG: hypothetical protein ACRC75_04125, partial [Olsenella sp.]
YQPKAELDLGAELPSLDPDRSAEARPRGGVKKGSHKHGGKGRQRSTATAESTGAAKATPQTPAKAHETSHQPSKAAGNKDRGKAGKARRPKRQSSPRNDRRGQDEDLPPQKPFSGPRKYKRHPGDRGGQ